MQNIKKAIWKVKPFLMYNEEIYNMHKYAKYKYI